MACRHKVWEIIVTLLILGPLKVFNSQTNLHWAFSNLSVTVSSVPTDIPSASFCSCASPPCKLWVSVSPVSPIFMGSSLSFDLSSLTDVIRALNFQSVQLFPCYEDGNDNFQALSMSDGILDVSRVDFNPDVTIHELWASYSHLWIVIPTLKLASRCRFCVCKCLGMTW